MDNQEMAELLAAILPTRRRPVAVRYASNGREPGERLTACEGLLRASAGETIRLSARRLSCPLGAVRLGLVAPNSPADQAMPGRLELAREPQTCSVTEPGALDPAPPFSAPQGQRIVMAPLGSAAAELVVFICTMAEAARLMAWASGMTGAAPRITMEGATCHRAIALPLSTGKPNVTLLSRLARETRGYAFDEILVTLPYARCVEMLAEHRRTRQPALSPKPMPQGAI